MKVSGIICEYNPFHNGHLYHIAETRKNGASHIVCVMSGNFVQRGDVAVLDKFTRAELAVKSGADLIIELPVQYCLSSAENFAKGAVYLLESTGVVDELSFGSECGDINRLISAMNTADEVYESPMIRELMKKGCTYPRAVYSAIAEKCSEAAEIISDPNNVLAVEYLRALKFFGSGITPFTAKREGAAHDSSESSGDFASASYIRAHMELADKFVPGIWSEALSSDTALLKRLERVILCRIRTASAEELSVISDMETGLMARIASAGSAVSLEELLKSVKTKNFTMARIKRVILSLLIGITKTDMTELPPYIRVLAFNEKGRELMSAMKKTKKIPVGTSLAKLGRLSGSANRFAELESRASDIYGLALESIMPSGTDYRKKIRLIDDKTFGGHRQK